MPSLFTDTFERPDGFLDTNGWAASVYGALYIYQGQAISPVQDGARVSGHSTSGIDYNDGAWLQAKIGDYAHGGPGTAIELLLCGNAIGAGWLVRITESSVDVAYRATENGVATEHATAAYIWQPGDLVKITYNDPATPGANAHIIRVYVNEVLVSGVSVDSDDSLTLGNVISLRIDAVAGNAGGLAEMATGSHDATTNVVTSVNGGNTAQSNGTFTVNGNNLDTVTEVRVSNAGANASTMTILQQDLYSVQCAPLDIHTSALPYGTLRCEVDHPVEGTINHDFTMIPEDGWQYVTLASVNTAYMAKDITGVADGDLLEVPNSVGNSSITISADSDTIYSPATQHDTTHVRWWYDASGAAWDSGNATIYRTDPGTPPVEPPVWTAVPSPSVASSGIVYRYEIGNLIEGTRPITLTDAGTALPGGLAYDSTYPEAIVGTPSGALGSETTTGIVCLATNADGATESAPFSLTIQGYPTLTDPNASGITANTAELRVTTDQGVGELYLIADTTATTPPSASQIIAGLRADGTNAAVTGSVPVTTAGVIGPIIVGQFAASSLVYYHMVQTAGDGINTSNVASNQFFTLNQDGTQVPEATPDTLVSFYTSNKGAQPPAGEFLSNEATEPSGTDPEEPGPAQDGPGATATKW